MAEMFAILFYLFYVLLYLSLIILKCRKQKETDSMPKEQKMNKIP